MRKLLVPAFLCVLLAVSAFAQTKTIADITDSGYTDFRTDTFKERTLVGKGSGVHDSDTATILDENKRQYKFRFNGIDAPKLKMPFGNKSKRNLSDWIFGKTVTVKYSKTG